ncbi:phosphatase PAP2 family protein [Mucilaginibacter paludis]|uniref:Phosphoesterase PA-phosphatase related protein n=1 Tax=Mucilaginibacter paludis DSM 18603 TaxID=714943 RepID=H1Y2Y6_9SPHI|nr:phosphatase PAP2 family protein [Mucilaginibacter paludis]EHQ28531.1 phosphoesterase PA-phosphatase related protein [Mucilaginibacter paludis DSM 18603]
MKTSIISVLKQVRFLFIPYLVILSVCLVIALIYSKSQIYFTVNGWHFTAGDTFFALWTNMGDGIVSIILTLILLFFSYRKSFLMGTSYVITSLIAQLLKRMVATPRPVIFFKAQASKMYLVKGVEMLETLSFPSGHSVSAFSTAVVLTYITPRKSWGLLFLVLAILVGYSRMYLSEHFFEDVVGGSALGVLITVLWISWIDNKPFIHSEKWNRGLIKKHPKF